MITLIISCLIVKMFEGHDKN